MSFHPGDMVKLNKDIVRIEGPYAKKGDSGLITEIFYSYNDVYEKRPNAKVEMDGKIKTFRLTSLDRINE